MKDERLLELAISALETERNRIDDELAQLRGRLKGTARVKAAPVAPAKKGRKVRTVAQTKAHSERMKTVWAERKKASK